MTLLTFDKLLDIYRAIHFLAGGHEGKLVIADSAQLRDLLAMLAHEREYGLVLTDTREPEELAVGDTVQLRADDPRLGLGLLADNIGDLLRYPNARYKEGRYYLIQDRFAYCDSAPPVSVQRYRLVLSVINLLAESAAYLDKEQVELIYIDKGKLSIPLQYGAGELTSLDHLRACQLLQRFADDTHRQQKLIILASTVQTLIAGLPPVQRFASLLQRMEELLQQFDEGYRLFVADFSYDKILDQMETAKLEELGKIHKTFSDVQNQILGIPVATIIVATQLKPTTTVDTILWINTAVLLGVWIFCILATFVLHNQQHTLDALEVEIQRKKAKVEQDYSKIKDVVAGVFTALELRLARQRLAFRVVDAVLVAGFLSANFFYVILTGPVRAWLCSLF